MIRYEKKLLHEGLWCEQVQRNLSAYMYM